ncbi:uncharacterized protein LOC126969918 isoform X2 [Leptidea sinapis]|uniref:uncharacterized protein LOC126969918 isoform X2 n=1 Tax=Leptidea sinapis TaxID=189913 RepID=UPI0021C37578|nr:uncharacterized protein LOC126969918 isoform X2 [Leptidea sinapis]
MEKKRDSFFLSNKKNKKEITGRDNGNDQYKNNKNEKKNKRQQDFDDNRQGLDVEKTEKDKKPFDKKAYRLKKYSKKYKLEQWEEQRKKQLLNEYKKSIKNDPMFGQYKPKSFDDDVTDSNEIGKFVRHPDVLEKEALVKKDRFFKVKEQFSKVKNEKLKKQQDMEKAKEEREKKLQQYKKTKQERFKKLSKKNKKGQPVMAGRMELLLNKIKTLK